MLNFGLKDIRIHVAYEGHQDTEAIFMAADTFDGKRVALSTTDGDLIATTIDFEKHQEFRPFLRVRSRVSAEVFQQLAKALIAAGHAPKPIAEDTLALKAHITSLENEVSRLHTIIARTAITGDGLIAAGAR